MKQQHYGMKVYVSPKSDLEIQKELVKYWTHRAVVAENKLQAIKELTTGIRQP